MLQRLIHSARVNVFESARFYYWVLVVLTSYFLVNRFLQKLSYLQVIMVAPKSPMVNVPFSTSLSKSSRP